MGITIDESGNTIFDGPDATHLFRLQAVRHALRLEQHGFRRAKGRTVKSLWAEHYGLGKRASYAAVIEKVEAEIEEYEHKVTGASGLQDEEDVTDADFE